MKERKKHRVRSMTAITAGISATMLIVWLVCMYLLTSITAEYAAARYIEDYRHRASEIADSHLEPWLDSDYPERKNYTKNLFWEAAATRKFSSDSPITKGKSGFIERPNSEKVYVSNAIYDAQGNLIECSWSDFFYFEYLTESQWTAREERSLNNARAFFNRELLTAPELLEHGHIDARAMRFTGTFDGIEVTPTKIEYIREDDFRVALFSKGSGSYTVSGVVQDYNLQWYTLYEDPDAVPLDTDVVTLYSDWSNVCYFDRSPSFNYNGVRYNNIDALLETVGPKLASGRQEWANPRYEGLDLLLVSAEYNTTYQSDVYGTKTYYSPYYYGPDAYTGEPPELNFYIASVVYCSPWRTAMMELRNVYIATFVLLAIGVLILRSIISRQLVLPIKRINVGISHDWESVYEYPEDQPKWQEPSDLVQNYSATHDKLRMRQNEITRLNTALEYAKDAEQNRRQMTSNVAHELKTPLAVIHSYAEGLKEHIAEEKRDKYIDVILSETEHLDDMVLELLDLSRLEAGKVRLALDTVSLIDLTHSVFERLDMTAQAKELNVFFDLPETCTVQADEARIRQVIENFASNAVKYTPMGGNIRVTISKQEFRTRPAATTFAIENDSPPLSDEALSKVWETFYRTDDSRSGGGTGLGLAIAKNIVELHGGSCGARNTRNGVEFKFTI